MDAHPYGWLSLLPPVVAIVLAIVTRRVVLSLLLGVFAGALITTGGAPLRAVADTLEIHLWKTLVEEDKLRVFAFTTMMGAMVGVINRSGGMRGLVEAVSTWANNRRRGQLTAWALGLLVFFDDYANTVLLGSTLRPLTDRLRISREKLAYLVDSTAAPVAGLALVSTWVAGEISYVQEGLDKIQPAIEVSAFNLFLLSIPYRFYVLWTLVFVAMVAWLQRDFGPMHQAETDAVRDGVSDVRTGTRNGDAEPPLPDPTQPDPRTPSRWYNAVIPVVVTVAGILWLMYITGLDATAPEDAVGARGAMNIFGNADAYYALVWGSLAGLLTAVVLGRAQRLMTGPQTLAVAGAGARLMLPALVILWLASALSSLTGNAPYKGDVVPTAEAAVEEDGAAAGTTGADSYPLRYRLYTGEYLGMLMGDRLAAPLLPTVVFILAAGTAFATGTSWGTMGILMPLVVPLCYGVLRAGGAVVSPEDPILLASVGGVLAGAIFGDHCSPISDTTILSSQASGCDHIAHVRTQLPYALTVAVVAIVCGTLPVGYGVPVWPLLAIGCVVMWLCLMLAGRKVSP
ncbi:MAG: Na+/H+ antiporter NhaC family protein [Pirellulales bacterium]